MIAATIDTAIDAIHPHEFQGQVPARPSNGVLRRLSVLQPRRAVTALVVEWVGILAAIAICQIVRNPLVYVAAVIWIGARQHALTVLGHDAAHYRFLPNKKWNDWIANVGTQWPMFLTVEGFRHYHGEHHRHIGTEADGNRKIWRTHTTDGHLASEWTFPKTLAGLLFTILCRAAVLTGLFWIIRGLIATVLFRRSWVQ
ncbi:MAG: fatty acid desaturase, partial [Acidobacteriaceae bacterium]|nr:fatty acid desaturase [Acidobacteriaceae bacterium]